MMKQSFSETNADSTIHALCLDCNQTLDLGRKPQEGQEVNCPQCGALLELVSLTPLRLSWNMFGLEEEFDE